MDCVKCGNRAYSNLCFRCKPRKAVKPGKHTIRDRIENKKFRESKLNHEGYLICEVCGSWAGSDADHIVKKSVAPELRYDENNKQIVCRRCHVEKDQ